MIPNDNVSATVNLMAFVLDKRRVGLLSYVSAVIRPSCGYVGLLNKKSLKYMFKGLLIMQH